MRIAFAVFVMMGIVSSAHADMEGLNAARLNLEQSNTTMADALSAARDACVGISDQLNKLKTLAGIGTAVSATGTLTATGATIAGKHKAEADAYAMTLTPYIEKWAELKNNNSNQDNGAEWQALTNREKTDLSQWMATLTANTAQSAANWQPNLQEYRQGTSDGKRGHKMGDVRTGTLAASAALNLVGATTAGIDMKRSGNLSERVSGCLAATRELNTTWGQVRINKITYDSALQQLHMDASAPENIIVSNDDLARVETIVRVCDEWSTINMSKIDNRATGALASSVVGAATGTAGTITSALANTKAQHLSGTSKEENLNKASNILAGTTAVAGGTATIFNATQISAIKRASTVADACEGALK